MIETLSIGAPLLLPPLKERMELLHSLLPQGNDRWDTLSRGQVSDFDVFIHEVIIHCAIVKLIDLIVKICKGDKHKKN